MGELRVLNSYKLLMIVYSHIARENSIMFRKPIIDEIVEAKNFSDIDDGVLLIFDKILKNKKDTCVAKISDFDLLKSEIKEIAMDGKENAVLKKIGINCSAPKAEIEKDISTIFPNESFLNATLKNFERDIKKEMENREKKTAKLGLNSGSYADDSILDAYNKKLSKCRSFDDIEHLLLYYTTMTGCDLINGFLRGDLSTIKSHKPSVKPSWGNSENVSFSLLLDTAIKAINLRKTLMYGTLDEDITVYRGTGAERFLKFIGTDTEKLKRQGFKEYLEASKNDTEEERDKRHLLGLHELIIDYVNKNKPLYQTKDITSTSLDEGQAEWHVLRIKDEEAAVVMKIHLKKGTAFGKDFRKTSFGTEDYSSEIVLAPMQKIRIKSARILRGHRVEVTCETEGKTSVLKRSAESTIEGERPAKQSRH